MHSAKKWFGYQRISVDAGVIDADYRGELKVLLVNHGTSDYEIKTGDRIAQFIVEKIVVTGLFLFR